MIAVLFEINMSAYDRKRAAVLYSDVVLGHQTGFSPSMPLTLVTNRITLLLHVLPHLSQCELKQRHWSVDTDEVARALCVAQEAQDRGEGSGVCGNGSCWWWCV